MQPLTSLINFAAGLRTYTHQKFGSDSVVEHATDVITEEVQRIAAGEASGGVHGRNRMGANGINDALVFGRIAGKHAVQNKCS